MTHARRLPVLAALGVFTAATVMWLPAAPASPVLASKGVVAGTAVPKLVHPMMGGGAAATVAPPASPARIISGAVGSAGETGASVAVSPDGRVALVGAPAAAGGAGQVLVYVQAGGSWPTTPTEVLYPPAGTTGQFGASVALSQNGSIAAIGAPGAGPGTTAVGTVYIFGPAGTAGAGPGAATGTAGAAVPYAPTPSATIPAPGGTGGKFGFSVALTYDGATLVAGAPVAGDGEAFVFTEHNGAWSSSPAATLLPSAGTDNGGEFGSSVALSSNGTDAVVGAPGAGASYSGAAYLYVASAGGAWPSLPALMFSGPLQQGAEFGNSVAVSAAGDVVLIGAPAAGPSFDGEAYLYQETLGKWPLQPGTIFAGPPGSSAWLGTSVALSANGQVALMGGPIAASGAAYLYTEPNGTWPYSASVVYPAPAGAPYGVGSAVALSANGQVALMGDAPFTGGGAIDGAAYLYAPAAGTPYQSLQSIALVRTPAATGRPGTSLHIRATASSHLPVAVSVDPSSTPGTCTVRSGVVHLRRPGTCLIDLEQSGDAAWSAAAQVQVSVRVAGRPVTPSKAAANKR
ncbi:MAG TPA: hypothetical protein VFN61_10740 [Acidimicrobiales bacterium]|nr:hypothetical protein [Acidimicrobiales bacterium]